MRKQLKALLLIFGLICLAVHAETIQLGGDELIRTAGWLDLLAGESAVNNVQPMSYTDANGITFTVTATANAGQTVNVLNYVPGIVGGSSDTRIYSIEDKGLRV